MQLWSTSVMGALLSAMYPTKAAARKMAKGTIKTKPKAPVESGVALPPAAPFFLGIKRGVASVKLWKIHSILTTWPFPCDEISCDSESEIIYYNVPVRITFLSWSRIMSSLSPLFSHQSLPFTIADVLVIKATFAANSCWPQRAASASSRNNCESAHSNLLSMNLPPCSPWNAFILNSIFLLLALDEYFLLTLVFSYSCSRYSRWITDIQTCQLFL